MRRACRALLRLMVLLLVLLADHPVRAEPVRAEERVVLHTVAGDLVLALYPEVAPRTVAQLLKLVRAGVYDGTAFVRVDPGFVAQVSAANDRSTPLTHEQQRLIARLPAEFSGVPHVRGTLSMAREDADPDSGETSFSILLGPAPHLDGKYTVFGRLEWGEPVLDEIVRVPRGELLRPVVRVEVLRAEVLAAGALDATVLAPARVVAVPTELVAGAGSKDVGRVEMAGGVGIMCLIGLVSLALGGRVAPSVHASLNLLMVLVGAFVLMLIALPYGQRYPWLAAVLFFGLIALFKVMGRFERAPM